MKLKRQISDLSPGGWFSRFRVGPRELHFLHLGSKPKTYSQKTSLTFPLEEMKEKPIQAFFLWKLFCTCVLEHMLFKVWKPAFGKPRGSLCLWKDSLTGVSSSLSRAPENCELFQTQLLPIAVTKGHVAHLRWAFSLHVSITLRILFLKSGHGDELNSHWPPFCGKAHRMVFTPAQ